MNWDDLRIFLEAVRAGDYSSAGRALGMDRTTIGRRIQRLEREIGGDIWERGLEGERPSAKGEAILDTARQMEQAYVGLEAAVGKTDTRRAVRIAGALELEHLLLPEISAAQAETGLSVDLAGVSDPVLALQKRQADLGLAFVTAPPAELEGIRIGRLRQGFYGYPEVSHRRVGWGPAALKALPQAWTRANAPTTMETSLQVGSFAALHAALQARLGAAWTWPFLISPGSAVPECAPPKGEAQPASAQLWLLSRETAGLSLVMRRFADVLVQNLAQRISEASPTSH